MTNFQPPEPGNFFRGNCRVAKVRTFHECSHAFCTRNELKYCMGLAVLSEGCTGFWLWSPWLLLDGSLTTVQLFEQMPIMWPYTLALNVVRIYDNPPRLHVQCLLYCSNQSINKSILYLTTLHLGAKKRSLKHVRAKTMYTINT